MCVCVVRLDDVHVHLIFDPSLRLFLFSFCLKSVLAVEFLPFVCFFLLFSICPVVDCVLVCGFPGRWLHIFTPRVLQDSFCPDLICILSNVNTSLQQQRLSGFGTNCRLNKQNPSFLIAGSIFSEDLRVPDLRAGQR